MSAEPTPVRVTVAGETFTGRLLCGPSAIGLVEVENARERRTVPARWCEPLTEEARRLLGSGDRFVGSPAPPKDAAQVLDPDPRRSARLPDLARWTLQELEVLQNFVGFETSRRIANGRKAEGWIQTNRLLKTALKERRMASTLWERGRIDPQQARDPDYLIWRAAELISAMRGELYKATGKTVFGEVLPLELEGIPAALQYYLAHYRKAG